MWNHFTLVSRERVFSFNSRDSDEDRDSFVDKMKNARVSRNVFVVSNTREASTVSRLFGVKRVAGSDSPNVAYSISNFGNMNFMDS